MRKIPLLVLAGLLVANGNAFAAAPKTYSEKKYRTGVELGLGIPGSSDYGGSRIVVGADFYIVHDATYDFGVSYLTGGSRHTRTDHRWRTNFVGVELNYKMPNVAPNFFLGASAGLVSFHGGDAFVPGFDDVYVGPKAGFFTMITPELSWGLEGKLLFVTNGALSFWLDALGTFRFHF